MSRPGLAGRSRLRVQRAYNWSLLQTDRVRGDRCAEHEWLFIATLPNSGSTALAKTLDAASNAATLRDNGEGHWLVPQMISRRRWDSDLVLDYDLVRAVWTHRARRRVPRGGLIVEKSPANLMRMQQLLDAFEGARPRLLVFTRDPVAICASWAKRYTPARVAQAWLYQDRTALADEGDFYRALGRICGERMTILARTRAERAITMTYEDLTADPARELTRLSRWCPELGHVPLDGVISGLKDYAPQPLRNMNAEQLGALSSQQQEWIRSGLEPFRTALEGFGYALPEPVGGDDAWEQRAVTDGLL